MKMEIRFAFARQDVIILVLPFPFWQQMGGETDVHYSGKCNCSRRSSCDRSLHLQVA